MSAAARLQRRERIAAARLSELHCPALRILERRATLARSEVEDHQLTGAGSARNPVLRAAHRIGGRLGDPARRKSQTSAAASETALGIDRRERDSTGVGHPTWHPTGHAAGRWMARGQRHGGVSGRQLARRSGQRAFRRGLLWGALHV